MKKLTITIASMLCIALVSCGTLGGTTAGSTASGSALGSILGSMANVNTIGNVLSSVIGLDKITQQNLVGTWKYSGPGCAFTSEKALAKAGGEVIASQIKQKMQPTYNSLGFTSNNTYITFNSDNTYQAKIGGKSMSGKWAFDESTSKITLSGLLLNLNCYAKRNGTGISILFEAKKLLTLLQAASALSGNQNLEVLSDLSKNYDGVRLGFDMN